MAASGFEGLESGKEVVGVIGKGGEGVEVGGLVVGDVSGVVREQIKGGERLDEFEKSGVAEGGAVDWSAEVGDECGACLSGFFGVISGSFSEGGGDGVSGVGQFLQEPESSEGGRASEEDLHDSATRYERLGGMSEDDSLNLQMPFGVEVAMVSVFVGDDSWGERPLDGERGVVVSDASLVRRGIELIDEVEGFRLVDKGDVAVGETFRYVKHPAVFGGEFSAKGLAEGRGFLSDVEYDIKESAADAADEFGFGVGGELIVHAAERAFLDVVGFVGLDEVGGEAVSGEFVGAERAGEVTAVVAADFEVNDKRALK